MTDRLTILNNELEYHLNAARELAQRITEEATRLRTGVSTSAQCLTDEQIIKVLARREKAVQKRISKS